MKNIKISNPVYKELKKLKLINDKNIVLINKSTRDKKINVYQDKKTNIIFLEKYTRLNNYYKKQKGLTRDKQKSITHLASGRVLKTSKIGYKNKKISLKKNIVGDDFRRFDQFKKFLNKKKVCDFGCGYAGFLTLSKQKTSNLNAIELNDFFINYLAQNKKYIKVENDINNFEKNFDLVTMFHVLEHLPNQLEILGIIRKKIKKKGKIIIEVPHARDILLDKFSIPEFKNFIFWSEHLVLHTKKSLYSFLKMAGFKNIKISFFQRYSFTNHLNWLINRTPGGHEILENLYNKNFDKKYRQFLENKGLSDTLIATAEK